MRRIVTGTDEQGRDVVVADAAAPETQVEAYPGYRRIELRGSDQLETVPTAGFEPPHERFYPPIGGYRVIELTLPPDSLIRRDIEPEEMSRQVEVAMPGAISDSRLDAVSKLHYTDTIDVGYVVEGEVWLELDDGAEVRLVTGDSFVQNGTRHAWRNRTDVGARVLFFLVGARRA